MKRLFAVLMLTLASAVAFAQANTAGTLVPSQSVTASFNSNDMDNTTYHGVTVVINITAVVSGTFTFTIQGRDPASGVYYTILASSALNGTGTTVLKVFPGIAASANVAANDILPRQWRLNVVGASTPSATFSVGYSYEL